MKLHIFCVCSSVCSPPRSTAWSLQTSGWQINSILWSLCCRIWSIWSVTTAWSCSGEITAAYCPPHMVIDSEWSHPVLCWFNFWLTEPFMLNHPKFSIRCNGRWMACHDYLTCTWIKIVLAVTTWSSSGSVEFIMRNGPGNSEHQRLCNGAEMCHTSSEI